MRRWKPDPGYYQLGINKSGLNLGRARRMLGRHITSDQVERGWAPDMKKSGLSEASGGARRSRPQAWPSAGGLEDGSKFQHRCSPRESLEEGGVGEVPWSCLSELIFVPCLMVKVRPVGCRKFGKRKPKVRGAANRLELHVSTGANLKILSKKASSGLMEHCPHTFDNIRNKTTLC